MPSFVAPVIAPGTVARVPQPVLRPAGLTVRPWRASDLADVVRAYAQPDIQRWHVQSLDRLEAERWIRSRHDRWRNEQGADWAVTDDTGVLGRIGLTQLDLAGGVGEVVYWLLPEARGRGVAAQALGALSDWAFDRLGLHRLELTHSTHNAASCRVAQAALFALEGTRRACGLHADGWHDMHLHARLAADPRPSCQWPRPPAHRRRSVT